MQTSFPSVNVTQLEPRFVISKGSKLIELFIQHWTDNLPDVSDRPEIPPEKTRFWMMEDSSTTSRPRRTKGKKRYPAAHSRLKGLRGKSINDAIDKTIASNKWCVQFKDKQGVTINLVDECVVSVWLYYICNMVRRSHHIPLTHPPHTPHSLTHPLTHSTIS